MKNDQINFIPFIGFMFLTIGITYGSLTPASGEGGLLSLLSFEVNDKLIHGFFYLLLAGSFYFGLIRQKKPISNSVKIILSFSIPLLLGVIIEIIQWKLIETRQGEFKDIIANSLGIFIAIAVFQGYQLKPLQRK